MRISTQQYFETSSAKYQENYSGVVKAQEQTSSGVRVQTAADDPVAAARLLMLQQQKDMLGQYNGNIDTLKNALYSEESVLKNINSAIQRASELALKAGNLGISDADRKSTAAEIGSLEDQIMGLLNTKDASGNYMFSGSKTDTPPYSRNNDGTYTYQGDDTALNLRVAENLSVPMGDTAKKMLETASNTGRTQATRVLADPLVDVDDGKVTISAGLIASGVDVKFADGQPYTVKFLSSTQYTVTDGTGKDITSEIPGNGTFDSTKEGGSTISLRGVKFDIGLDLGKDVLPGAPADALVKDREFTLALKPDSFSVSRTASNPSTAQLTGGSVSDPAAYASTFPNSGLVVKFGAGGTYNVYAQPYSADSKAIASDTLAAGATSITVAGVTLGVTTTPAPAEGDQFLVGATSNKNENVLDTLSRLRRTLETPSDGNPAAQKELKDVVARSIGNLTNAYSQIDQVQGDIGARLNILDIQAEENTSLGLANTSTMNSLGNIDFAEASINLNLQQTMLQASQLAFVKISQLSLFNKM
ncbi:MULTISPECIES: flagellar hook-associated protein 3 [Pseudomonas]|uniref:flagellar hook-associated protein 3 n=1 Tax=Pseudomonas TaxID=286 RepID=UPI000CFACDD1|nr:MULTISPECIES: flagellar hook-associated protein 3 [Pseudomonas]PQZ90890.1 flagellar hook-associated protein 3 [Pseudomonas trivialis]PRB26123.1 flagellar hook-associated protein 3 [Pseudomonas sp. MYb60]